MTKKLEFIKPILFSILLSQIFIQQSAYAGDDMDSLTYRGDRRGTCSCKRVFFVLGLIISGNAADLYEGATTYKGREAYLKSLTSGCHIPGAVDALTSVKDQATTETPFRGLTGDRTVADLHKSIPGGAAYVRAAREGGKTTITSRVIMADESDNKHRSVHIRVGPDGIPLAAETEEVPHEAYLEGVTAEGQMTVSWTDEDGSTCYGALDFRNKK